MNSKLVNPDVLRALTRKELLDKYIGYWKLAEREGKGHFFKVAEEYLKEHNKRTRQRGRL